MPKQFTRKTENFICDVCGTFVTGNGYTNHCPCCLSSKHVDVNPGDRTSSCLGIMFPANIELKGDVYIITHVCEKCGHTKRNKVAQNDSLPALCALSAGTLRQYIKNVQKQAQKNNTKEQFL